jgi:hypothetical protein
MCEPVSKPTMASASHPIRPDPTPLPTTSSRRRRLWDVPRQCHCPVIGICLTPEALRKLVNKTLGGQTASDDYEVHAGAVAECGHRSRLSEALQQDLEQRYARTIQDFRQAKNTEDLALLWKKTVEQGAVAAALWAALTHPRCDVTLQEVIYRNMHMLQHHAATGVRIGRSEFDALLTENAVLGRELGRVQTRSARWMQDKSSELAQLNAQLRQTRAAHISKDRLIAGLYEALLSLQATLPDFEAGLRWQRKVAQMALRQTELEAQVNDLRQKRLEAITSLETATAPDGPPATTRTAAPQQSQPVTLHFHQKTVLCVGGRSSNVPSYRELIERVGGRFAHHDGGLEDRPNVLQASLAAADLVICQTGCISHNAYWKVKDFCKRTGKRCIFVENPSTSSFARGLAQIAVDHFRALAA